MSCNFKIILTGASGLIGSAIADALYKSGMNLVLACKRSKNYKTDILAMISQKELIFGMAILPTKKPVVN